MIRYTTPRVIAPGEQLPNENGPNNAPPNRVWEHFNNGFAYAFGYGNPVDPPPGNEHAASTHTQRARVNGRTELYYPQRGYYRNRGVYPSQFGLSWADVQELSAANPLPQHVEADRIQHRLVRDISGVQPNDDAHMTQLFNNMTTEQKRDYFRRYSEHRDALDEQTAAYLGQDMLGRLQRGQPDNEDREIDIEGEVGYPELDRQRRYVDLAAQSNGVPGGLPEELLQRIFPDPPALRVPRTDPAFSSPAAARLRSRINSNRSGLPYTRRSKK